MQIFVQAFTGGFDASNPSTNVVERVAAVAERAGPAGVVIGWNTATDYLPIVERLHDVGRQVYLWLPVFSEYGPAASSALDYLGQPHQGAVSGADDDFSFACPSQKANIGLVVQYYQRWFVRYGFDGVMLDKIRFSSFGNGFRAGLGCFCPSCQEYYRNAGVPIDRLAARLQDELNKSWLMPEARVGLGYRFADPLVDGFYCARAKLITQAVTTIVGQFRQLNLRVGLDVFAPPFAYLVGQDLPALADLADFIKPMTYRVTDSPAGIPYEAAQFKAELTANRCPIGSQLEELWATDDLAGRACYDSQLKLLAGLDCAVLPGVEVNHLPICATSPAYVESSLSAIDRAGLAGAVLSWNVLAEVVYPELD